MALFPPELIAGVLMAFVQVRLRGSWSVASLLVSNLSFFLPPEDELIRRLNGHAASDAQGSGGNNKSGSSKTSAPTPLSTEGKMQQFYVKVAQTEPGVFQQTLFFELYEMLVILVTSALAVVATRDGVSCVQQWQQLDTSSSSMEAPSSVDISAYALGTVLLVSLWFPLQVTFAQGALGSSEARLGVVVGVVAAILSLFAMFAPPALLDFDLEGAPYLVGARLTLVLRALGFEDGDLANVAGLGDGAWLAGFALLALVSGVFAAASFLPAFRFARMYADLLTTSGVATTPPPSMVMKLLLHANVLLPLLVALCWLKPLTTDLLVPVFLSAAQWSSLRIALVGLTCLVRLATFRCHVQRFLDEPRDAMVALVRHPGVVDGPRLQNVVRIPFNYVPVLAVQYLAPMTALLSAALLLVRLSESSLGVCDAVLRMGLPEFRTPDALSVAPPDLGGFRVGDDVNPETMAAVVKGMSQFRVVPREVHEAVGGFLVWWLAGAWFTLSLGALVYWKNVAHGASATTYSPLEMPSGAAPAVSTQRRSRETPKLLKNQLKGLKTKKQ